MKKLLLTLILFALLLACCACGQCGCAPGQLRLGTVVLCCGDTEVPDTFWAHGIRFVFSAENQIRSITVTDPEIVTCCGLTVGDTAGQIEAAFRHEIRLGSRYLVLFHGCQELDPGILDKPDDGIWIIYSLDSTGRVVQIQICDTEYGKAADCAGSLCP